MLSSAGYFWNRIIQQYSWTSERKQSGKDCFGIPSDSYKDERSGYLIEKDENYGNILIVEDTGTGYGNRIYINEGYLVEDYGKVDGALMPDYATRIGETSRFETEKISETLLKLETDQGDVFVHIRKRTE